ncbi:hypothetical protein [Paenibacillus sp. JJ-100]|uniref:hypothetical protein n=1 Tax=Paenibacillus sp. JJ-100 TaxID=2974896 RepID=UPI00232F48B5|nr:hypothetical protein [Paenibacillus sp. JJ-100]
MELKVKKITDYMDLSVSGQGCKDDCIGMIWKAKTDKETKGCYYSNSGYTPETTSWF